MLQKKLVGEDECARQGRPTPGGYERYRSPSIQRIEGAGYGNDESMSYPDLGKKNPINEYDVT